MSRYSHSQIQQYLNCPLDYRLTKIDKIKPDLPEESLHLTLWTLVHQTLEELYKKVGDMVVPTLDYLLWYYKDWRDMELDNMFKRNDREVFPDDMKEIFYHRWVEYIKYYYEKYKPFDQWIAMKTEESICFPIDENINFSGKIDRMDINWETITIVDYKTNKSLPKDGYDSIEEQITLYWIWVKNDYWKKINKIIWKVIYLHLQREYEREITNQKIAEIKTKYLNIAKEIDNNVVKYKSWDKTVFPPKQNAFCDSCIFKFMCPLFAHSAEIFNDEKMNLWEFGEEKVRNIIDKYIVLKEKSKDLEVDLKFYGTALLEYANQKEFSKLYWTKKKISITRRTDFAIDELKKQDLKQKLEELGLLESVVDIDLKKIKEKIKDWALNKEDMQTYIVEKTIEYLNRASAIKKEENPDDEIGE